MSRRKHWAWSAGAYGRVVRVFEKDGYLRGRAGGREVALHWPDTEAHRERAKAWARDQAERLELGLENAVTPAPTIARVFALYLSRETPRKSRSCRYQDTRASELFARVWGADRDLHKLTLDEWSQFIAARASGVIDARGEPVDEEDRRPVRARAIEADLECLQAVIRWACAWQDPATDQYLMREDPTRGRAFRDRMPHEQNPRQPIATQDRYEAIAAVAGQVHPFLPQLLALVNGTGRRIRAVLELRYEDLRLAKTKATPHGAIQWPDETDKMGKAWSAPINAAVRAALDQVLAGRPGIGAAPLFPSPADSARAVSCERAAKWLRKAERLAKVRKQDGTLWHAYRRKWGTERKGLPVQDVAAAGGWKDTATLQRIYQQPDAATLYRVVSEPAELREAHHG
jgi:hypothetical protein